MNKQSITWEMKLDDNLVGKRFSNKEELEKKVEELINKKISFEDTTNEDNINLDYEFTCGIETQENYYYVDIYWLKTRDESIYVTEVSVDNE